MSALAAALVAAQKEMPKLHKDSTADTGKFAYKYMSLDALLEQVLPVLNKHGLYLWQAPEVLFSGPTQTPALKTTIVHDTGEHIESIMPLALSGEYTAQAQGSAITYARRYAILAMLGLAPDEDDDGAAAQRAEVRNRQSSEGASDTDSRSGVSGDPGASSEGFQAPKPATEKPVTQGVLDELDTVLRLLNSSYPEHPGEGRKWEDVAKGHCKDKSYPMQREKLSLAQARELITWLEDEYQQAAREAQIPFDAPA